MARLRAKGKRHESVKVKDSRCLHQGLLIVTRGSSCEHSPAGRARAGGGHESLLSRAGVNQDVRGPFCRSVFSTSGEDRACLQSALPCLIIRHSKKVVAAAGIYCASRACPARVAQLLWEDGGGCFIPPRGSKQPQLHFVSSEGDSQCPLIPLTSLKTRLQPGSEQDKDKHVSEGSCQLSIAQGKLQVTPVKNAYPS